MGIDYWSLAKDYKEGDVVHKVFPTWDAASPFVGRVTAVLPGIGFCDVQWPHGNERVSADELLKANPALLRYLPPTLDQSYVTYEIQKARQASLPGIWRTTGLPPTFHRDLAQLWSKGSSEVSAYDDLWHHHGSVASDDAIRDEVGKFYLVAKNILDLRIQAEVRTKTAAYWVAQNRQYRVTRGELTSKKPGCPRCATAMRRTTYKMEEGSKHRLFGCPKCLFLLKTDALLAPDGGPVTW